MVPGLLHKFLIRYKFLTAETCVNAHMVPLFEKQVIGAAVFIDLGSDKGLLLFM
jgi:hypothetical protein